MNLITVFSAAVLLISLCTHHAWAVDIQVGAPTTGGTDVFDVVKVPGGPTISVSVPLLATDTAPSKAKKVAAKMLEKGIVAVPEGNKVSVSAISVDLATNKTGETFKLLSPLPDRGKIDYHGLPGGFAIDGSPSVFQASLGFNGVVADSDLLFSSLSSPTTSGILTDTFNQFLLDLPPSLQSNLALDLSKELISFNFPSGSTDGFIGNFTSDVTVEATGGLSEVPEPSALLLLGSSLTGLATMAWRRHRRQ